jgi:hypothetical protein
MTLSSLLKAPSERRDTFATVEDELSYLRIQISRVVSLRERLKAAMEAWYENRTSGSFPQMAELLSLDEALFELDSRYKHLWDQQQAQQQSRQ